MMADPPSAAIEPSHRHRCRWFARPAPARQRLRDLHLDHRGRLGHRLQRPCRSRHRHPHRAGQIVAEELDVSFARVVVVLGDTVAASQPGRDHRQRNHPDHGRAAAPGRGAGAAFPARARRRAAGAAGRGPLDRGRPDPRPGQSQRQLWRTDRRRDHPPRAGRRRPRQSRRRLYHRRPVGSAHRPAGQGDGRTGLCPRRARARHAAWPRGAAALCRRRCRRFRRHQPDRRR